MPNKCTPMFHVLDVAATVDWYRSNGFNLIETAEDGADMVWAHLSWGTGELMLSAGGQASDAYRRDVDLYVEVENVEAIRRSFAADDMVEDLHDTFYGMREFIIRDPNRFWITFGQPIAG